MAGIERAGAASQHKFVFHGKAGQFFIICLVNLLLTIVTLGIYLPWAFVKSRRYIYENMELNGVRFRYSATGGALFLSLLLLMLFFIVTTAICSAINPALAFLPVLAFILLLPLMMVKGLRYQAMMTSLNGVRFGFSCPSGRAMWVMLGLPVVLMLAGAVILYVLGAVLGSPSSLDGLMVHIAVIVVAALVIFGVINGVSYSAWIRLLGNQAKFGKYPFSVSVSTKRCVLLCTTALLILVPFIFVIGKLISPFFMTLAMSAAMGGMDETSQMALFLEYGPQITVSYLLYFAGILLASVFMLTALRNLFINSLKLGEGVTFRSSISFIGMLLQIVVIALVSSVTFGLAYPWAKMRFMRYMADNTTVVGDLDSLELVDTDDVPDTGFFTALSRGMMPAIPFI